MNNNLIDDEIYKNAKSWPFQEAQKLLNRKSIKAKGYALFETGYGPSGLPHIGTFGEVARTTYVKRAFELLTGMQSKLFTFSDDRDGLRKIPDNIPNKETIKNYLDFPLTDIPDPFECHKSFGEHNNNKLMEFLDHFNFKYEFQSATNWYKSGKFNDVLLKVLKHHEEILDVMLASLREERAETYSPFLPISSITGKILQVKIEKYNIDEGTIVFKGENDKFVELPVINGNCKMQWKVDWAARWVALDVDYEMSGKDLIDSVKLSSKICKILGGTPPDGFNYELFLDEEGKKISKSKGNGLSVDEWLRYAPPESLSNFMFASPKSAKKLCFNVIPKNIDDYNNHVKNLCIQTPDKQVDNPAWHINGGSNNVYTSESEAELSYSLLLNLVSVCNAEDKTILWGFIKKYIKNASPEKMPYLDKLAGYAINYYHDFVKAKKQFISPDANERIALKSLHDALDALDEDTSPIEIQSIVFSIGKQNNFTELKVWFDVLYKHLLGQSEGPRMGSFIALFGIKNTKTLIEQALQR